MKLSRVVTMVDAKYAKETLSLCIKEYKQTKFLKRMQEKITDNSQIWIDMLRFD